MANKGYQQPPNRDRTISTRAIVSLAILKANWDRLGSDYIENFVPFVAECLKAASRPEVSINEVQSAFVDNFGLRVPLGALKTILHRCAKRGYVRRESGIYIRDDAALSRLGFASVRADVLRKHENLSTKLIDFCKERHGVSWTADEADAALLAYLEERSPSILAAAIEGSPIPAPPNPVTNATFLVNAFVQHVFTSDPEGLDFLETIVKGTMLANVLIFPEIGRARSSFRRLEVYLDTGFLIGTLGLEGSLRQAPFTELLYLLRGENANLCVFEHTYDELLGILDAAARSLGHAARPRRDRYVEHFESIAGRQYTPSDIELAIARLPDSLARLWIKIKKRPEHTFPLGLDERRLEQMICQEVAYSSERAKQRDVDSLTSIHRLRNGKTYPDLETCKAIFVTTNVRLVRGAAGFFRMEYEQSCVPLALQDYVMTTIVWLKNPLGAPDLPRKRIIADCYAAMNPPERLWRLYLDEVEALRNRNDLTENDYHLLRYSTEARRALTEITLGD